MEFCPECKFVLYTKLNTPTDSEEPQLTNYCKNCGWTGIMINTDTAIYKRNYQEDFIAERVLYNKYSIYDAALPRVTYDCINNKCATNIEVDKTKAIVLNNLPPDYNDQEFNNLFEKYKGTTIEEIYRIRLSNALIICTSPETKKLIVDSFKSMIIDSNPILLEEYEPPNKEVLYMKYDITNMKYLYMCTICGTSWKKD
jgi:hypothetical protein